MQCRNARQRSSISFQDAESAARAYDRVQLAIFGPLAITNFPAETYPDQVSSLPK